MKKWPGIGAGPPEVRVLYVLTQRRICGSPPQSEILHSWYLTGHRRGRKLLGSRATQSLYPNKTQKDGGPRSICATPCPEDTKSLLPALVSNVPLDQCGLFLLHEGVEAFCEVPAAVAVVALAAQDAHPGLLLCVADGLVYRADVARSNLDVIGVVLALANGGKHR